MDSHRKLVALFTWALLCLVARPACAGYAQVSPPSGFTTSAGASFYQAAANDVSIANGVRGSAGVVNVGGRAIAMPAAYRFASNAGVFAARASFGNPALFATLLVGSAAYNWYTESGISVSNGQWMKRDPTLCYSSPCYEWYSYATYSWHPSVQAAAADMDAHTSYSVISITGEFPNYCVLFNDGSSCTGLAIRSRSPDTGSGVPATQADLEAELGYKNIPEGLAQVLRVPLPVLQPVLNPSGANVPLPQPMRVPMGQPQPVPNTNPQKWKQPYVDLNPVATTPWTVDVIPGEQFKESPDPLPQEGSTPVAEPGTTTEPVTPDLCEKNPGILACQTVEMGTVTPVAVSAANKNLSINKDSGWGPDDGICPAPKTFTILGVALSMPFTLLCDFATAIRPMFIAFAWLSAALTFFGMGRK